MLCSKLNWHEDKDNDGTTDSKNKKKQRPNDPNGEHQTKQVPKDVIRSPRKTRYQMLLDLENFQDTVNTYNKKISNAVGLGFVYRNKCMIIPTLLI